MNKNNNKNNVANKSQTKPFNVKNKINIDMKTEEINSNIIN